MVQMELLQFGQTLASQVVPVSIHIHCIAKNNIYVCAFLCVILAATIAPPSLNIAAVVIPVVLVVVITVVIVVIVICGVMKRRGKFYQ